MFTDYPGGLEGLMVNIRETEPPAAAAIDNMAESVLSSLEELMDFAPLVEANIPFGLLQPNMKHLLLTTGLKPNVNPKIRFRFLAREAVDPQYSFSFSWKPAKTFDRQIIGPIANLAVEPQLQPESERGILVFRMKDAQQIDLPKASLYQLDEHESIRYDNESVLRATRVKRWELPRYLGLQVQLLEELIALTKIA